MPIYKMSGQKDGKQKYRVRINFKDKTGKARQIDRVAFGLSEAKLLELQLRQELTEETLGTGITLNALHNEFVASRKTEIRETTNQKSQQIINAHILPTFGTTPINKITIPALQEWKNKINDTELSLKTKQNVYSQFRALLNFAVRMQYIPKNLILQVGNFKDANRLPKKEKIDFYYPEEYLKFIAAAKDAAERAEEKGKLTEWSYYVFFSIAFYTGMRKGEINSLTWEDLDGIYIHVTKNITQKLKGDDRIFPPKNDSSVRTLQMPIPLMEILDEHKRRCKQIEGFSESSFICGVNRPLRDTSLENRNAAYAKAADIRKIRIHDFRHTHASLLCNESVNIKEIARRLGHAKIDMTWNTYSHLYPREEERAVNILNKIV